MCAQCYEGRCRTSRGCMGRRRTGCCFLPESVWCSAAWHTQSGRSSLCAQPPPTAPFQAGHSASQERPAIQQAVADALLRFKGAAQAAGRSAAQDATACCRTGAKYGCAIASSAVSRSCSTAQSSIESVVLPLQESAPHALLAPRHQQLVHAFRLSRLRDCSCPRMVV